MDHPRRCRTIKVRERICIVVHRPTTSEGHRELMKRTDTAHADSVLSHLRNLRCSGNQKAELIDTVIQFAKSQ